MHCPKKYRLMSDLIIIWWLFFWVTFLLLQVLKFRRICIHYWSDYAITRIRFVDNEVDGIIRVGEKNQHKRILTSPFTYVTSSRWNSLKLLILNDNHLCGHPPWSTFWRIIISNYGQRSFQDIDFWFYHTLIRQLIHLFLV